MGIINPKKKDLSASNNCNDAVAFVYVAPFFFSVPIIFVCCLPPAVFDQQRQSV
jgi:hypothetical protein